MHRTLLRVILFILLQAARLLPLILRATVAMLLLMVTSTLAVVIGVPEATDRMAKEWAGIAHDVTGDSRLDVISYWFFRGVAFLMLVAGWICIALTTVALLDVAGIV